MKRKESADHISTLLGMGTAIEGTLTFKDTIRIDGTINGKINSENGTLVIGERANVEAQIRVGAAIIKGTVNGHVEAVERIDVHAPAKITGDIQAPVISIETGVVFNGKCNMVRPGGPLAASSQAKEKPAEKKPA